MTTKRKTARRTQSHTRAAEDASSAAPRQSSTPAPLTATQRDAAVALLRSWRDASEEEAREQEETFAVLRESIDRERARLGMRLLFS